MPPCSLPHASSSHFIKRNQKTLEGVMMVFESLPDVDGVIHEVCQVTIPGTARINLKSSKCYAGHRKAPPCHSSKLVTL
jgi:hypothetical protein